MLWSEGFGLADVENNVPVTPLTRMRIGSISKVLTATGVARLVEQGKLDLDAPVQQYVPGFPVKQWPVTTRQLAAHIAGIRHYVPTDFTGVLRGGPHFNNVQYALTIFDKDPLLFQPGTDYSYSSYGFNLIGAVVEGASKQEFLTFMQSEVFDPLGLTEIVADHPYRIVPYRASFYVRGTDGTLLNASFTDNSYKWAGGGFLATAEDLVRFGTAHLQPGYLKEDTMRMMFTTLKLTSGKDTGVGLGWRVDRDSQGRRMIYHTGALEGGRGVLIVFPESKVVIAALANLQARFGERDMLPIAECFQR